MNTNPCFLPLLIIYLTTNFLIFQTPPLLAHKITNPHHGHLTNVTKHLHFPNFINTIDQSIKFLGSASISKSKFTIQIPYDDASPAVDLTHQSGRAIYSSPIRLFDPLTKTPASFNTTFSFQFTTTNGGGSDSGDGGNGGSGLAFIIVPDEFTVGRSGPWLGMLNDACDNSYKSVAVEFDSSYDPDFGDPNDDHVGINLGQVVSFKTASTSLSDVSLHEGLVNRAWITYDAHSKLLDAYLGLDGEDIPKNPILSTPLDLSHHLKEYMFVGFSASTGNSTQVHDILSWNFSSLSQAYLKVPNVTTTICHRNVAHEVAKYSGVPRTSQLSSFVIFLIVLGLCLLSYVIYYCNTKLQLKEHSVSYALWERKQKPIPPTTSRPFTIHEMYKATKGFGKDEVLNSDTRGVLYRGVLSNECRVSVKRFLHEKLDKRREISKRVNEMTRISQTHQSLVTIRGWCYDCKEVIIISDYYPNGSLDKWLFGIGVVPWTRRFKLISDVAETLSYLHSQETAHGNLKTSSVFLDFSYGAVLGDYGFGLYCNESSRVEPVSGKRNDVFEFGMLVLEIVAGKRAVGNNSDGGGEEMGLLGFACAMHERGEMVEVVDKMLGSSFDSEQAIRVLEIGMSCTWSDGPPSMGEVVEFLNMQKAIPKLPTIRSVMSSSH